jgi:hypothetical protein
MPGTPPETAAGSNRGITGEGLKKRFPRAKLVSVPGGVNRIAVGWLKELGL